MLTGSGADPDSFCAGWNLDFISINYVARGIITIVPAFSLFEKMFILEYLRDSIAPIAIFLATLSLDSPSVWGFGFKRVFGYSHGYGADTAYVPKGTLFW